MNHYSLTKMKTITFMIFVMLCTLTHAQSKKDVIQGIVKDKDKNPLPGVHVIIKQTKAIYSCVTDENGKYQIAVTPILGDFTIEYSYLGMKTKYVEVTRTKNENCEKNVL